MWGRTRERKEKRMEKKKNKKGKKEEPRFPFYYRERPSTPGGRHSGLRGTPGNRNVISTRQTKQNPKQTIYSRQNVCLPINDFVLVPLLFSVQG